MTESLLGDPEEWMETPVVRQPSGDGGRHCEFVVTDAVVWANAYEGEPFHALLCDPPYHLTSITERFGKDGAAPCQHGTDGAFARASRGFMGQEWDGGDIAFRPETWAAFKRILHPGAFIMAFASTRGYHRMAVAIEDAGFIIHPMIGWVFGNGFPKATRIDTQIDRQGGLTANPGAIRDAIVQARESRGLSKSYCDEKFCGGTTNWTWYEGRKGLCRIPDESTFEAIVAEWPELACYLEAVRAVARELVGVGTNGLAQGPLRARSIGAGGFGFRREYDLTSSATPLARAWEGHRYGLQAMKPALEPICVAQVPYAGRPADCITRTGAGTLNVAGSRIGTEAVRTSAHKDLGSNGIYNHSKPFGESEERVGRWPANFALSCDCEGVHELPCPSAVLELQSGGSSSFFYTAKPDRKERDTGIAGPTVTRNRVNAGGLENDPRWAPVKVNNPHPTVKPLDLCRWLATLLLPPDAYAPRRLLVPFAGSGSEAIAASLAGWEHIVGLEQSEEYATLARARLAHWLDRAMVKNTSPDAVKPHRSSQQMGLFDEEEEEEGHV